jgi:hypothetical protein
VAANGGKREMLGHSPAVVTIRSHFGLIGDLIGPLHRC